MGRAQGLVYAKAEHCGRIAGKPRKRKGKVYAPGEIVQFSDRVMVADANGSLRRRGEHETQAH